MNLATSESSAGARRAVLVVSGAMVAVAVLATLFGQRDAIAVPAVLPLLIGCVLISELMSAYVLFAEFARSRLGWLLYIAAAYLLTAVLSVPYILAFPSVFGTRSLLGATDQTSLHLWIFWHLAFPCIVLGAIFVAHFPQDVRLERASSVKRLIAITIVGCLTLGFAAPFLSQIVERHTPDLIHGRAFTRMTTAVILPVIVALDAFAVAMLYHRSRNRTAISLWLLIAVVASALDAFMGVSNSRYTYGWYVGKLFLMLSSSAMVVAFIGETARLGTRLAHAVDDLKRTREREHHLAQERVQRLANYDELTGLFNRHHLEECLRTRTATPHNGDRFAVLFLTLDHFKDVNDQFGHAAVDRLLIDVAARLIASVSRDDIVARFSGEEFVIVSPTTTTVEHADDLATALREALQHPFNVPDGTVRITASAGIAMFPDDGISADAVLNSADTAAHQAERAGGNTTRFYSRDFSDNSRNRRRMQDELSLALLRDQFVLHYQPIIDLRTGALEKTEALIRWVHPNRGIIGPDDFIPLAEQTGLMQLIGYWVIEEAVRQARAWESAGTPTRIAVNVSARQLDDEGFVVHLERTLGEARLPAQMIELEITESAAMTDASRAQDVLEQCRALGAGVSLDDFGTYYSSLTYLKQLPIDTVKIDRSFIRGLPFVKSDAAIVSGIIGLARALERKVVAEGIETDQQRAWLIRAGCEYGQGYLFGKAMSAKTFQRWRRAPDAAGATAIAAERTTTTSGIADA